MEPLLAFDPNTEVSGRAMLALSCCFDKEHILPIAQEHGLNGDFQPETWYPLQLWLDVFREIIKQQGFQGTLNLVDIGRRYAETAYQFEGTNTLEDTIIAVNDTYQLNHRNGYPGELSIVIMGPGYVQIIDHTPYPCDFTYGMLYGLTSRFRVEGETLTITHDPALPCRKKGDDSCAYDITW